MSSRRQSSTRRRLASAPATPDPMGAQTLGAMAAAGCVVLFVALCFSGSGPSSWPSSEDPGLYAPSSSTAAPGTWMWATRDLPVRSGPIATAARIATLHLGERARVPDVVVSRRWVPILGSSIRDTIGYAASSGLAAGPPPPAGFVAPVIRSGGSGGYIRGPRGGCYTYSASGRKRYVDRSLCD